jgi:hypothetical protein
MCNDIKHTVSASKCSSKYQLYLLFLGWIMTLQDYPKKKYICLKGSPVHLAPACVWSGEGSNHFGITLALGMQKSLVICDS